MRLVFGKTEGGETTGISTVPETPLFAYIKNVVEDSKSGVSEWQNKQDKYFRMRQRVKKEKTFPFKKSSNLRMPTLDTQIKKVKAAIMAQVFGARPIVQATPTPSGSMQTANNVAKFLDHLIMDVMDVKNKAEICVDQSLEKGMYLGKVYWRLEISTRDEEINPEDLTEEQLDGLLNGDLPIVMTEVIRFLDIDLSDNVAEENMTAVKDAIEEFRRTKKEVKFTVKDVTYNFPDTDFISPERVYVPTDSGFDLDKATSITVEFFLPLDVIKANGKNKNWDMSVINKIEGLSSVKQETSDLDQDTKEGIERLNNPSKLVRIWETYGLLDINEDGKKEKCIVTSLPDFSEIVRKVKLDNFSHKYPLVKFFYELTSDRWFSHRGMPELLEDLIQEIDVQHNMKIDGQTMKNFPMVVYRAGMVDPRKARVNPTAAIPVRGLQSLDDTIKAINLHNPNTEFSNEREEMLLQTRIQELVGQVDYSLQSTINRRQPRTFGEVELQQAGATNTFSLDAGHYIDSFSKLFQKIFDLWSEFGPDEYEFNYFGEQQQPTRIKLTKEEIQGKYNIKVRGNDQNTNPQVKVQQAQQIILAVTNPMLLQAGVIGPQQMAEGVKRFYQALGIEEWESLIISNPQPPPPPDPRTAIKPDFKALAGNEQAQVLQAYGVQADTQTRTQKQNIEGLSELSKITKDIGEEPASGRTNPPAV